MGEEKWVRIKQFSGIDQSVYAYDGPAHSSPDAQNMETVGGMLSTAKGYTRSIYPKLPAGVYSLMAYTNRDLLGNYGFQLFASTLRGLYRLVNNTTWEQITGSDGGLMDYVNYGLGEQNVMLMTNQSEGICIWNGSYANWIQVPNKTFNPRTICLSHERVWVAAPRGEAETVFYSKEFAPTTWTGEGSGFINIPSWDSSSISAVRSLYNEVVAFKDNGLYRIYGTYPGEFGVARVHGDEGTTAERTIIQYKDRVYFFNQRGICYYDGMRTRVLADDKLKEIMQEINTNYLRWSCAARLGTKLLFAVPDKLNVSNTMVIEYDVEEKSYMLRRGIRANCFLQISNKLYFGSDDGYIYQYGVGREYPAERDSMQAHWTTPRMDLGSMSTKKYATSLYTTARGQGKLRIEADFGKRIKSKEIELQEMMRPIRLKLRNKGRAIQYTFRNVDGAYFDMHAPQMSVELDED